MSNIRIAERLPPHPTDDDLAYFRQVGVEAASIWTTIEDAGYDYLAQIRQRLADHGIELWNVGILDLHCDPTMVLGLPGFDAKLEQYVGYLRDLGRAGIGYTTYAHMANIKMLPYYQSAVGQARGGLPTREFDAEQARTLPLSHDRVYSEDEIWSTFTRFLQAAIPAAEEAGVRIGLHPDDPPVPSLGGVRRIFSSFDGYQRAVDLADSPNFGLCFCVGTWAEGGAALGKDVYEMIDHFGAQEKLFKIHFRNVDRPMPVFRETLVDDGYIDMHRVMEGLHRTGFDGILLPDHVPGDGRHAAYTLGYMRAVRKQVCQL